MQLNLCLVFCYFTQCMYIIPIYTVVLNTLFEMHPFMLSKEGKIIVKPFIFHFYIGHFRRVIGGCASQIAGNKKKIQSQITGNKKKKPSQILPASTANKRILNMGIDQIYLAVFITTHKK